MRLIKIIDKNITQGRLYSLAGRTDDVCTLDLREGSDSFEKYGPKVTVEFLYTQNERKMLESHLINMKPSDEIVKAKLDILFPNLKEDNYSEEIKNNVIKENKLDNEAQRKANIIKMKEIYNNLNQSYYFNDALDNNNIDNQKVNELFL